MPGENTTFGLGDLQLSGFVSPSEPGPGGLIWGAGAIAQMPTDTNDLGNKNWGLGPTAVVLKLEKGNPWVYGVLVNNVWSLTSDERGGAYNNLLVQYFLNYNFPGGTYISSAPIITANWKAESSQRWTVPFGAAVGHIFHLGWLPVNTQLGAYYNVVHPDDGANWQVRLQVRVAVQYRDRWYWIEDDDNSSKQWFNMLQTLVAAQLPGGAVATAPVLTIPVTGSH
jgi:hypothetical protein